jgi:hypothetical protein
MGFRFQLLTCLLIVNDTRPTAVKAVCIAAFTLKKCSHHHMHTHVRARAYAHTHDAVRCHECDGNITLFTDMKNLISRPFRMRHFSCPVQEDQIKIFLTGYYFV